MTELYYPTDGLIDNEIKDIDQYYKDKHLRGISCYPSFEPHNEVLAIWIAKEGISKADLVYLSIWEPKILDYHFASHTITDEQKAVIYEYTSSHWTDIVNALIESYSIDSNISEFESRNISINQDYIGTFPTESPDYRLL